MKTKSPPGQAAIHSLTSATPTRVTTRTRPGRPTNRTSNIFASWRTRDSARLVIMGRRRQWACPRTKLPSWDDIQFVVGQLHKVPLLDDEPVGTDLVIGPRAKKTVTPRDSVVRIRYEFRCACRRRRRRHWQRERSWLAPESVPARVGCFRRNRQPTRATSTNSRPRVSAFPGTKCKRRRRSISKGGQGAKTGTGGHLPGEKVKGQDRGSA